MQRCFKIIMRAKICFLIAVTYSSNFLVSFGDVDGDIELDDKGVVLVYNRHYDASLNICWIKNKSECDRISNTICRQMGLAKAESSKKTKPKSKIHNLKIAVESCTDDASHIYRCKYSLETFCNSKMIIAVTCAQAEYLYEGQLRLHPVDENLHVTRSFSEGMLEVFLNNRSTFVCNETFGENEAITACRQLGYTTALPPSGVIPNGQNKVQVWIGFNKQIGRVDCDEPKDCLTKCYSKPPQEEYCESGIVVYLQCDFVTQNLNSEDSTAGSPSACAIKETTASISTAGIAGIIAGSLLFAMICLIGVCYGIYFSAKAKKPCVKSDSSDVHESFIKLNYSAVENYDSACTDSEQEDKFDRYHYQPPAPLPQHDETD